MPPTLPGRLAESMGCDGVQVDSAVALEAALAVPRAANRPLW